MSRSALLSVHLRLRASNNGVGGFIPPINLIGGESMEKSNKGAIVGAVIFGILAIASIVIMFIR